MLLTFIPVGHRHAHKIKQTERQKAVPYCFTKSNSHTISLFKRKSVEIFQVFGDLLHEDEYNVSSRNRVVFALPEDFIVNQLRRAAAPPFGEFLQVVDLAARLFTDWGISNF